MSLVFVLVSLSLILVLLLKIVSIFLSEKVSFNREDLSPYECGFEHHNLSRLPFSLRYFFLTLIFLLFDLEIILILFSPFRVFSSFSSISCLTLLFFLSILYFRLVYEWNDGTLEWVS